MEINKQYNYLEFGKKEEYIQKHKQYKYSNFDMMCTYLHKLYMKYLGYSTHHYK